MENTPARQKSAEFINSAMENIEQFQGQQRGRDGFTALQMVVRTQGTLAIASALLAMADAIEITGKRITDVLREGNNLRMHQGGKDLT